MKYKLINFAIGAFFPCFVRVRNWRVVFICRIAGRLNLYRGHLVYGLFVFTG